MQTWSDAAGHNTRAGAKAIDFALAISGWPTIYSVVATALPSSGGDLNSTNGFTSVKPWMNIPRIAGSSVKGRPEEGSSTIGQADVEILDRWVSGARSLTDLLSRDAYVNGTSSMFTTTLNGAITRTDTTVVLTSGTNFAGGSVIHIGQEAILLGSKSTNTYTGCTRGYLLTDKVAHATGVKVYSALPGLYRRPAYLYKGYQDLTLDKWAGMGFGLIASDSKNGQLIQFAIMQMSWEMLVGSRRGLVNPWTTATPTPAAGRVNQDVFGLDFSVDLHVATSTNLSNGHYAAVCNGEVMPIRSVP